MIKVSVFGFLTTPIIIIILIIIIIIIICFRGLYKLACSAIFGPVFKIDFHKLAFIYYCRNLKIKTNYKKYLWSLVAQTAFSFSERFNI